MIIREEDVTCYMLYDNLMHDHAWSYSKSLHNIFDATPSGCVSLYVYMKLDLYIYMFWRCLWILRIRLIFLFFFWTWHCFCRIPDQHYLIILYNNSKTYIQTRTCINMYMHVYFFYYYNNLFIINKLVLETQHHIY